MLYIPCVEFQFCVHYIQLPLEKRKANLISKGGTRLWEGGGKCPPSPSLNEALQGYACFSRCPFFASLATALSISPLTSWGSGCHFGSLSSLPFSRQSPTCRTFFLTLVTAFFLPFGRCDNESTGAA